MCFQKENSTEVGKIKKKNTQVQNKRQNFIRIIVLKSQFFFSLLVIFMAWKKYEASLCQLK